MSDDVTWITVNGAHVPIKEGQDKGEAIKEHFASKRENLDDKIDKAILSQNQKPAFEHKVITQSHTRTLTSGEKQVTSKYTPSFQDDRGVWQHGPIFQERKEALQFGKEHKGKPYDHEIKASYVNPSRDRPE